MNLGFKHGSKDLAIGFWFPVYALTWIRLVTRELVFLARSGSQIMRNSREE